jgi:hypothetical protein
VKVKKDASTVLMFCQVALSSRQHLFARQYLGHAPSSPTPCSIMVHNNPGEDANQLTGIYFTKAVSICRGNLQVIIAKILDYQAFERPANYRNNKIL